MLLREAEMRLTTVKLYDFTKVVNSAYDFAYRRPQHPFCCKAVWFYYSCAYDFVYSL